MVTTSILRSIRLKNIFHQLSKKLCIPNSWRPLQNGKTISLYHLVPKTHFRLRDFFVLKKPFWEDSCPFEHHVFPRCSQVCRICDNGGRGIGIQHQFAQLCSATSCCLMKDHFLERVALENQNCRPNFTPAMDDLQAGIQLAVPGLASSSHSS